jgi:hypothetical protein
MVLRSPRNCRISWLLRSCAPASSADSVAVTRAPPPRAAWPGQISIVHGEEALPIANQGRSRSGSRSSSCRPNSPCHARSLALRSSCLPPRPGCVPNARIVTHPTGEEPIPDTTTAAPRRRPDGPRRPLFREHDFFISCHPQRPARWAAANACGSLPFFRSADASAYAARRGEFFEADTHISPSPFIMRTPRCTNCFSVCRMT